MTKDGAIEMATRQARECIELMEELLDSAFMSDELEARVLEMSAKKAAYLVYSAGLGNTAEVITINGEPYERNLYNDETRQGGGGAARKPARNGLD